MPDVVRVGGADLVRTRESDGTFTYRPLDASTGAVVDAATFEAREESREGTKALERSQSLGAVAARVGAAHAGEHREDARR